MYLRETPAASRDPSGHSLDSALPCLWASGHWRLTRSHTASRNRPRPWRVETRAAHCAPEDGFPSRRVRQGLERPGRLSAEPRKRANQGTTQDVLKPAVGRAVLPYTSTLLLMQEGTQTSFISIPSLDTAPGSQKG